MVAERFEPNDVFALGFDSITTTLEELPKRVGILFGIRLTGHTFYQAAHVYEPKKNSHMTLQDTEVHPPTQAVTWDPRSTEPPSRETRYSHAQASAGYSSQGSSTPSHFARVSLGPTVTALLQAHARYAPAEQPTYDGATRGQPTEMRTPDRPQSRSITNRPNHLKILAPPRGEGAGGKRLPTR